MGLRTPYHRLSTRRFPGKFICLLLLLPLLGFLPVNCAQVEYHEIEATAYCPCGECNDWKRGTIDPWNRYVSEGKRKGQIYTGKTASGTELHARHPGLFSVDSICCPWMIPVRILFAPWLFLPQKGTIAADTQYFAFGTKMYVPGYGWGVVEDRGGAIKGPARIDLYHRTHKTANKWGRQTIRVKVIRKD